MRLLLGNIADSSYLPRLDPALRVDATSNEIRATLPEFNTRGIKL